MSAFSHQRHSSALIQQHWTNQDGVTKAIIRTPDGKHHTVNLPFSAESMEGRRAQLMDGVWRLAGDRA